MHQHRHALSYYLFFFFNDTATTEIYTLSLHDALPILQRVAMIVSCPVKPGILNHPGHVDDQRIPVPRTARSEEHTSELQSHLNLVCRLLLEKKKETARKQGTPAKTATTIQYNSTDR